MLKIATWNVNSIRLRLNHLINWLKNDNIDIALLQEIKCTEEQFPYIEIEDLGYNIKIVGQKSFNGVAILSKYPIDDVITKLPEYNESKDDNQARYIEAIISVNSEAIRVASVYVPNGQEVDSAKYHYKMLFLTRLYKYLKELLKLNEKIFIGGDFNVALENIDVYDSSTLLEKICFETRERKALRKIMNLGFFDNFRLVNPDKHDFSWWDYRGNSFNYNKGMRIDYIFSSPLATQEISQCYINSELRSLEKPSDHVPVISEINIK